LFSFALRHRLRCNAWTLGGVSIPSGAIASSLVASFPVFKRGPFAPASLPPSSLLWAAPTSAAARASLAFWTLVLAFERSGPPSQSSTFNLTSCTGIPRPPTPP
jgi:hypothetical protein